MDPSCHLVNRFPNILRVPVSQHEHIRFRACHPEGSRRIVFAVGSREYRNEDTRTLSALFSDIYGTFSFIERRIANRCPVGHLRLIYLFQTAFVYRKHLIQGDALLAQAKHRFFGDHAQGHSIGRRICPFRQFQNQTAVYRRLLQCLMHLRHILEPEAQSVPQTHLDDCLDQASAVHSICRQHFSLADAFCHVVIQAHERLEVIDFLRCQNGLRIDHLIACRLHLRRQHILRMRSCDCQRNQRGRHVHFAKGTRHGVLASNRSQSQLPLCLVCAQQRRQWLAPALLGTHSLKIFLEGEVDLMIISACGYDSRYRLDHRIHRPMIGTPAGNIGVIPTGHHGHGCGLSGYRQLGYHGLNRRHLILAAIGHQHRRSADTGIEHLYQALLTAYGQIAHDHPHLLLEVLLARAFR